MLIKSLKLIGAVVLFATRIFAQSNDISQSLPSNSYEEIYRTKYPDLNYTYEVLSQTHNYSNNWDFDGDGVKDQLFFIGNGAVHLYFHLKICLSSNKKAHIFPFLEIDNPFFDKKVELDNEGKPSMIQQFVVADFDDDKLLEVYIQLNEKSKIPQKWKAKGLSSNRVIVDYSKGKLDLKNWVY